MNNAGLAQVATPTPAGLRLSGEPSRSDLATSLEQYKNDVTSARRCLAWKLADAFKALEDLSEKEFVEIMQTLDDGLTASDLVEKFRMYKDNEKATRKGKRHAKKNTKKKTREHPF